MREKMLKRFTYLATGEMTAVIVFLITAFLLVKTHPELRLTSLSSFWTSFLILEIFLLLGSFYWFIKQKALKRMNQTTPPAGVLQLYKIFRIANIGLLILSAILLTIEVIKRTEVPLISLAITAFVFIFAVLEYLNYYFFQLSYQPAEWQNILRAKKLRSSCLSKDLRVLKK